MLQHISVNHYRILLLVGNLVLAVGITVQGGYNVLFREVTEATHPEVSSLSEFRYVKQARATGPSGPQRVQVVAEQLQPRKPAPPPPPPERPIDDEKTEDELAAIPGGPLAEDWEYIPQFVWPDSPLNNSGVLRKKSATPPTRSSISSRSSRSLRTRRTPTSRTSRSLRSRRKETQVSFSVKERKIENEEHDLNVFIESADGEQLVYWYEKDPKKLYALKRAPYSDYFERETDKRLLAPKEEEEEDKEGKDGDGDDKKVKILLRPADYRDRREDDYQKIRSGKISPTGFKSTKVESRTTTRSSASSVTPTRRPASKATFKRQPKKMSTQDKKKAMQELKGFLKSEKIPEKDRKKLREALMGTEK